MEEIRPIVGCCGWSEAKARYFADFPSIELQTTFYQPPAVAVARRWKAKAPEGFVFCMKAWQLITHTASSPTYRRLKSGISPKEHDLYGSFRSTEQVWLAWERTREIAEAVDARVIVFQCPKSFLPTRENIRNLNAFFHEVNAGGAPAGSLLAWEPRGDEWKPGLIRELCDAYQLIHCVDPFVNDSVYGETLYWRLHGKGGYRYRYSDADLDEMEAKLCLRRGRAGENYVMFNNIYSREDARRFMMRTGGGI